MLSNFDDVLNQATKCHKSVLAVAAAEDEAVIEAIVEASNKGIVDPILVGDSNKILEIFEKLGLDLSAYTVIHEPDNANAAKKAVELISSGRADMVMKGFLQTSVFLKAILNKEKGLRTNRRISHVGLFDAPGIDKMIFITDAAFNMFPDLYAKKEIIENAVDLAQSLGLDTPKVACLAAIETVNADMPATLESAALTIMNARGQIKDCIIEGPLAFDNAVSAEAASHKQISSSVAGDADILLVPNIESGNILYKSLTYIAGARNAAVLVGAAAPVIVTSRSDSTDTKVNSIALAAIVANQRN